MATPGNKDKEKVTTDTTEKPKNKIYQAIPEETINAATQAVQETLNPTVETETAPTIEDMLAGLRKPVEDQKTSAEKMQRYYALTDAMKALGRMGGAAVGGAIGGDVLAGATPVEYKPNRGYLDAIENAKKASDRLRSIDDTGFKLAFSKQQRDEERAYQTQKTKEEREYQAAREARQREWDKELLEIKAEIEKAALEGNYKLKTELETKMATMQQQFKKDMEAIKHRYAIEERQTVSANQQAQLDAYNNVPLAFDDGTAMNLTKGQQDGMRLFFMGKEIDGVIVDKDNVDAVIRANPQLAREYMRIIGGATTTQSVSEQHSGGATGPTSMPATTPNGKLDSRFFTYVDRNGISASTPTVQPSGNGGYSVENDPWAHRLSK